TGFVALTRLMEPAHPPPPPGFDDEATRALPRDGGEGGVVGRRPGAVSPAKKAPRARRCPSCEQAFSGEARFCPFDGDALVDAPDWNPSADPLLGKIVEGRYEVISVIGE